MDRLLSETVHSALVCNAMDPVEFLIADALYLIFMLLRTDIHAATMP